MDERGETWLSQRSRVTSRTLPHTFPSLLISTASRSAAVLSAPRRCSSWRTGKWSKVERGGRRRRMLIRCRQRRRHQKRVASGLVTSSRGAHRPASPLFECAIVGTCDDDERAFLESPETDEATGRRMMGIVSGISMGDADIIDRLFANRHS